MDLRERPDAELARHPWEVSRMRFFRRVIARAQMPTYRWLDAGAGDGWLAQRLTEGVPNDALVCWDAFYSDDDIATFGARAPRVEFVREAPAGPFDVVSALDVAEHVEDDRAFMATLHERLAPGGHLLFSVPAWPGLFTAHDTRLAHHRRYRPGQARRLLEGAGFEIVRGGGLFHSLLPVRVLEKTKELVQGVPDEFPPDLGWRAPALVTETITRALGVDTWASEKLGDLPVDLPGLSYWALCRKP